jgi:hypothetical protein
MSGTTDMADERPPARTGPAYVRFRVQGRLVRYERVRVVRDETRHAVATDRDEAARLARLMLADGFTVWIWGVADAVGPAGLNLVQRLTPETRTPPTGQAVTGGRCRVPSGRVSP